MVLAATALVFFAFAQNAGAAIADEEAARLQSCIETIETDPETAYEDGLAWLGSGSRPKARHCVALSLVALGREEEGAAALETLASAPDAGSIEQRAVYLSQSGNAWLAAGLPQAAVQTLTNAIRLSPAASTLLTDRGAAYLAIKEWRAAADDLDAALEINPSEAGAHALRARARLGLEEYDAALADIEDARLLAPQDIELLVLRGEIREAKRLAD